MDEAHKPYGEILHDEISSALEELRRSSRGLLLSGLSAGLDVGFSMLLMVALAHHVGAAVSDGVRHVLVANAYAVGFLFVVLGRSELFTDHTTRAVLPWLDGRATVRQVLRLWALVYVANQVGAALFAVALAALAPRLGIAPPSVFEEIALPLVRHPGWLIFASAVLAGWLMGLLAWLVKAVRDTTALLLVVWLVTGSIGVAGLHHCILGTVEVLSAVLVGTAVTPGDYGRFLLWATLGNAVGGAVFVALLKHSHASRASSGP